MPEISKVYVETCPFIDMGKFKAGMRMGITDLVQAERERDVWHMKRLLAAGRDAAIQVVTSSVTIAECIHLGDSAQPVPTADTQRFFKELLTSGRSGVYLVQPIQAIFELARDLRWRRGIYLKPMDSIHVATALKFRCGELLTRDGGIYRAKDELARMNLSVVYPSDTGLLPSNYMQDDFDESLSLPNRYEPEEDETE